jgi:shikimate kinase
MAGGDTVWIVGMMGVGKSSVARLIAQRLGRPCIDTDAEVERAAAAGIPEIFAREGEASFRRRERAAIDAIAGQPVIAALGGGAIAQPGAAKRLAATGITVALRATPETLLERLGDAGGRPILAGLSRAERLARIEELLREREPHYGRADLAVDTDALNLEEVADRVLLALARGGAAA